MRKMSVGVVGIVVVKWLTGVKFVGMMDGIAKSVAITINGAREVVHTVLPVTP